MDLYYQDFARRAKIVSGYFSQYEDDPTRMNHDVWLKRMGLFESWFLKYNNGCGESARSLSE